MPWFTFARCERTGSGLCLGSPAVGGAGQCGWRWANRRERGSRCVPLPRVASDRLECSDVGCDLNPPFPFVRALLAIALGDSLEASSTGLEVVVEEWR